MKRAGASDGGSQKEACPSKARREGGRDLETAGLKLSVEAPEEAEAPKTKPVRRRTRKTAEAAEAAPASRGSGSRR